MYCQIFIYIYIQMIDHRHSNLWKHNLWKQKFVILVTGLRELRHILDWHWAWIRKNPRNMLCEAISCNNMSVFRFCSNVGQKVLGSNWLRHAVMSVYTLLQMHTHTNSHMVTHHTRRREIASSDSIITLPITGCFPSKEYLFTIAIYQKSTLFYSTTEPTQKKKTPCHYYF